MIVKDDCATPNGILQIVQMSSAQIIDSSYINTTISYKMVELLIEIQNFLIIFALENMSNLKNKKYEKAIIHLQYDGCFIDSIRAIFSL